MFTNILLATDDPKRAKQAARMAGETARSLRTSNVCILVAYPSVPDYLGVQEMEKATAERQARAETLAETLRQEVGAIPGQVQTDVLEGPVAEAAAAASQVQRSDLIVLSAKGLSLWGRLKAWSRAGRILDGAPCPVLLVQ
jgi:nucleotide-binding universal stress UspA family protein